MGNLLSHALSAGLLLSAFLVVSCRNPVHGVLWLILSFILGSAMMIMMGAELMAMLLVVVYVGAVAVLFVFVLMMLDVDLRTVRERAHGYIVPGLIVALALCLEIVVAAVLMGDGVRAVPDAALAVPDAAPGEATNARSIGAVLFTDYFLAFQMAGLVLLVAQIGAIVLTLRHRRNVKRQDIGQQTARRRAESYEMRDLPPGRGL